MCGVLPAGFWDHLIYDGSDESSRITDWSLVATISIVQLQPIVQLQHTLNHVSSHPNLEVQFFTREVVIQI